MGRGRVFSRGGQWGGDGPKRGGGKWNGYQALISRLILFNSHSLCRRDLVLPSGLLTNRLGNFEYLTLVANSLISWGL